MSTQKFYEIYEQAKQGDPEAIYTLGTVCENENNEASGRWKAERLYRRAAYYGHAGALLALGNILFADGKTYLAADMWFLAAEKGNYEAMTKLSKLFAEEGMNEAAEDYSIRAIMAEDAAAASSQKTNRGGYDNDQEQ